MNKVCFATPWYELNITSVIIGSILTIISFVVSHYISSKNQIRKQKQDNLYLITQTNGKLFSLIYQGSLDKRNIDSIKIREELEQVNILFILPQDIREPFQELYDIYFSGSETYRNRKEDIHVSLKNIVNVIEKCGVDAFGHK